MIVSICCAAILAVAAGSMASAGEWGTREDIDWDKCRRLQGEKASLLSLLNEM
jgi:hypothetical protein